MELPHDPAILLSTVNMLLRDRYSSLDELCRATGTEKDELTARLAEAGFGYSAENNRFW
ncbi:MAG: DUF4250 domain-containing protein [Alloprevotella sp.]|nr:DUF4250 domain-containing protein [Alloprevotella sp.]